MNRGSEPPGESLDDRLVALLVNGVIDYAIFVLDPMGHVQTWNVGAERLKGYSRAEILGEHFSKFYTAADREAGLPEHLLAEAATRGRVSHHGWRVRKGGERFWGDVTITALRDPDGRLQGFAKVTRDLTDRHEAEVALDEALQREREVACELARLHENRTQFLASISHDLRTPIASIRGSLDLLRDGDDDPEERQHLLGVLTRNTERLFALTQQLSELSRLERGRLRLHPKAVDVGEAIDDCVISMESMLQNVDVEVAASGVVEVDPLALERILTNLLANAAQHSPAGSTVRVLAEPDNDQVVVTVEDEGPGVPEADRAVIFEEFRQGTVHPSGGLGLGLNIVREYVEVHGGRVWVEDRDGGGARFRFTLPMPHDGRASLGSVAPDEDAT